MNRYHRQQILPEIGTRGQQCLSAASVLLVGVGGLGSPAALYLAGAGIGRLGLIDPDTVSLTNLHRQVLYQTAQEGQAKVLCAQANLQALNPEITIETYTDALHLDNSLDLINQYDLILDGSDNFATRYLVNDACVISGKPNIHASILRFAGQLSLFCLPGAPCYRCLFPKPPTANIPNCAEAGVLGTLPGILGIMQAQEGIKFLLNIGQSLQGRLLSYDALNNHWQSYHIRKNPHCPLCSKKNPAFIPKDYTRSCHMINEITVNALQTLRTEKEVVILDVREADEYALCHIDGALHIPLSEVSADHETLAPRRGESIYIYCHHGMRSLQACQLLHDGGFERVYNIQGGIDAWATHVDKNMARY